MSNLAKHASRHSRNNDKFQAALKQDKGEPEPTRKTLLDALQENLKFCHRVTYVHRMIYIGEHSYENVGLNLTDAFEKVVKNINEHYCEEKLTGYFLYHLRYFCHFIEGSEESLIKHLKHLFMNEAIRQQLGRMKLLIVYHHVNQRILDEWITVTAKPPTLLEKINMNADLPQAMEKVRYCIDKLYNLGNALRPVEILIEETQTIDQSLVELPKKEGKKSIPTNLYGQIVNPIYAFLPELTIIEFLLTTTYTQDLRRYLQVYGDIPYLDAYEDLVWPVPCDFVPMNIFEQDEDPVTDLTNPIAPIDSFYKDK